MEQLKHMTGTDLVHVPFRGSAPAITALTGGQIDLLFDLLPATKQLIEAGKIKLIAVAGNERLKPFPNAPTVAETLAGFEADTWMGVSAPPGTPKEITKKVSDTIGRAFRTPAVSGRISAHGHRPARDHARADGREDQGQRRPLDPGDPGRQNHDAIGGIARRSYRVPPLASSS